MSEEVPAPSRLGSRYAAQGGVAPSRDTPGRVTPGRDTAGRATPGWATLGGVTPDRDTSGRVTPDRDTPGWVTPGWATPRGVTPGRDTPGRVTPGCAAQGGVAPGRDTPGRDTAGRVTPGWATPGHVTPGRAVPALLRGRARGLGAAISREVLRLRETHVLVARDLSQAAAFAYRVVASQPGRWPGGPLSPLVASAIPSAWQQRRSSRPASPPGWSFALP
jgi:hypothetical protein